MNANIQKEQTFFESHLTCNSIQHSVGSPVFKAASSHASGGLAFRHYKNLPLMLDGSSFCGTQELFFLICFDRPFVLPLLCQCRPHEEIWKPPLPLSPPPHSFCPYVTTCPGPSRAPFIRGLLIWGPCHFQCPSSSHQISIRALLLHHERPNISMLQTYMKQPFQSIDGNLDPGLGSRSLFCCFGWRTAGIN